MVPTTALLGALGGGALRLLPELVSVLRGHDARSNAVELARIDLAKTCAQFENAVELAKARQGETEAEARTRMAAANAEALLAAQQARGQVSGERWIDALNHSVRPVVTYWLLAAYTAFKVIVIYDALKQDVPVASLAPILRTDDDVAVFAGAITFWFLDQTIRHRARREATDDGTHGVPT